MEKKTYGMDYTRAEIEWHGELAEVARHIETWGYLMPTDQKLQMDQCLYVVFAHLMDFISWDDTYHYLEKMPPIQEDIYDVEGHYGYWLSFLRLTCPSQQEFVAEGLKDHYICDLLINSHGYRAPITPFPYFSNIILAVLKDYEYDLFDD